MIGRAKLTGGIPITQEIAIDLRQVVFGSAAAPPRGEWIRTPIIFGSPKEEFSFGLRSPRNGTRGLQTVIQAFIIKHYVFDKRPLTEKFIPVDQSMRPNESQQNDALICAMSEILWSIGERTKVTLVLPGELPFISHSQVYFQDSITEKLFIFYVTHKDSLHEFLKKYLYFFTENPGPGSLLFLYSAVMTRTPTKVVTDLDGPKGVNLMGPQEEGSLNIVTLLLTGRATPYLHNGVVYIGDEDHYALPQFGILTRTIVGLLVLHGDNESAMTASRQPGSRLKTPAIPIWVTSCCGHFGVLFNTNKELLRNYHAEKRFDLHYYTCAGCYVTMTIDNLSQVDNYPMLSMLNQASSCSSYPSSSDNITSSPLERLINTKWADAIMIFKGPMPPSISY